MRNNNSDYNSEAVKIANALKPMFKTWFDEWARSCVRVKKMTVSTAPSNGIVGVKDAFSDKEIFAKYTTSVANAKVGDTVWCRWYFDNMQTLYASDMGNVSSADASFDNATINNDLSVYGDFSIGSTILTEASLAKLLTTNITDVITFGAAWISTALTATVSGGRVDIMFVAYTASYIANNEYTVATIAADYAPKSLEVCTGHTTDANYNPQGLVTVKAYADGNIGVIAQNTNGNYFVVHLSYTI